MPTPTVPLWSTCSPWCATSDLPAPSNTVDPALPVVADCIQAASDILFQLAGRQFPGMCSDTVRPQPRRLIADHGRPITRGGWSYGYGWWGFWPGPAVGSLGGPFPVCNALGSGGGCTAVPAVSFDAYPLAEILQVLVDGAVVDPGTYRIDDFRWLVRTTEPGTGINPGWPCCQRLDLPTSEVGTWQVSYVYGRPPPALGKLAAAELANEFLITTGAAGAAACRLPERTTSIVRSGLAVAVADPAALLSDGRLGLRIADRFLLAVNRHGLARSAYALNPDLASRVRRSS